MSMNLPAALRRRPLALLVAVGVALAAAGCNGPLVGTAPGTAAAAATAVGWSQASHAKGADPNYTQAFPQDRVAQLRLRIEPADWQAMLDDMTTLYGARGPGGALGGPGGMGGNRVRPDGAASGAAQPFPRPDGMASGAVPPGVPPDGMASGAFQPGPMGPGGGEANGKQPVWVPATVTYDGKTWVKVGVRFKGNSSLMTAWRSGTDRLPLKLDFDQFGDSDASVKDQRFWGFKQLALSTNMGDATGMRDAIAYDLLADSGLAAAETAFYEVVLDHGAGEASQGLYTAVEVVDDTVVKRVFGKDKGNIYEADGRAASLAAGLSAQIQATFEKENNKNSDWSDVEALYTVLNDASRTSDPAAWRAKLEKVFDVDVFLHWLAIAAVLQHWDAYGQMTHNYYLYHDPATDKLTWISWDHNLVLGAQPGGGGQPAGPQGGPGRSNVSLDKQEVTAAWPLIRYLLDQPDYHATYLKYLRATVDGPFKPDALAAKYQRLAALLRPYAEKAGTASDYDQAVQSLITATRDRETAVRSFLATQ